MKYFVYRGLSKDSFINGAGFTPQEATNSAFIERFWTEWNDYKTNTNNLALPNPGPQSFGYDRSLPDDMDVEKIYDNSQPDNVRPIFVKEGEWIGDFAATAISFEIIMDTNLLFDLFFVRGDKHQIDVTGLSGLDLRVKREEVLSFIDPAAFFGLHYDEGVSVSTYNGNAKTTEKKKQGELYASLLDNKFANKNNLYLDIRSEKGYSYNFYRNYENVSGENIKIGNSTVPPIGKVYGWDSWPLMMIDSQIATSENTNNIKISLRIDDNIKPILFCENKNALAGNHSSQFIGEKDILNGSATDWSKELTFIFPNIDDGDSKSNVPYYIQLNYFRQEYNPNSPNTVLKNENYFNSAFCPINLPNLGDSGYLFLQSNNANFNFIQGKITGLEEFSYVSNNGAYWDASRIIFFSKALYPNRSTKYFFDYIADLGSNLGFNLDGNFNRMSFPAKNIHITRNNIQENLGNETYQRIKILDIVNYNDNPNSIESILCLGITQEQFQVLKNISGLSDLHPRHIYIEEINESPFTDKDGKSFRKFKLKIQGLDQNGNCLIIAPPTDIFVYSEFGLLFASKDFADQEINSNGLVYMRNYEENIGHVKMEETSHKRYEDYFIENINPRMKVEVNDFINALASILDDSNAYQNIKTLVENSAKDIWDEAVSFVQANDNNNPDDRPLYWARNKMEVALKSHPYFEDQFSFSKVNPGSELEKMIKLFEEKSRNYTSVDFSSAPVGTKKILITGFDPFFLNENHTFYGRYSNIRQSNPSGVCALALHNTRTENGQGYIQSMIVPVRYADFDDTSNKENGQGEGIVENYIKRYLEEADAIITISQATPDDYHIDVFATATRGGTIDNLGFTRMENSKSVNNLSPETIVTTLPDEFVQGHPKTIFYGKYQITKYGAQLDSSKSNYPSSKVYSGPGGNYLSNEIFYRVALLREGWIKSKLPNIVSKATGHFHISKLQDESIKEDFNSSKTQILLDIVKKTINQGVTGL